MAIARERLLCLVLLAILVSAASSSQAATLSLTGGSLSVQVSFLGTLSVGQSPDPIPVSASSGAGSFSQPAGLFAGTITDLPTELFTGVPLFSTLNLTVANGAGSFSAAGGPGGGFGGIMPLSGQAVIGILGGLVNIPIGLSVAGAGGVNVVNDGPIALVISGTGWTTGPVVITKVTFPVKTPTPTFGYSTILSTVNTVTISGSDGRTAGHRGTLTLVTPVRVLSNLAGNLPIFATQTLTFVPEPGRVLLLLAAAGMATVAARRRR